MAGFSSDFDKWAGKPQDKSQTSHGEEKCVGTIHITVSERGQNSI